MKHILLVDDQTGNLDLLHVILTRLGYTVELCDGGAAALDHIDAHSSTLGLIITDWWMPEVDGLQVCRVASIICIPTVILTAHGSTGGYEKAMGVGAVGYIEKPFNTQEFVRTVRENFGTRLSRDTDIAL